MDDEAAIRALLEAAEGAWAAGDGTAYGACFTGDASYSTCMGAVFYGAEEIARAHQALFSKLLKDTRMTSRIRRLRFLTSDVAVATTHGRVAKCGNPGDFDRVQTFTIVREASGQWLIAAFQNTRQHRLIESGGFTFI